MHDEFGGKAITRQLETAEHKAWRAQQCRERGMRRPADVYDLATTCFECHVISDEKLINESAHPVGDQFELLAWTQGEVRHNFLLSKGSENAQPSAARKRLFFVVGTLLDLEHSLRAYANSTTNGKYRETLTARVKSGVGRLMQIDAKLPKHPFVSVCAGLREKPLAELGKDAVDSLAAEAARLAKSVASGPDLPAGLDSLLPPSDSYRGKSLAAGE